MEEEEHLSGICGSFLPEPVLVKLPSLEMPRVGGATTGAPTWGCFFKTCFKKNIKNKNT